MDVIPDIGAMVILIRAMGIGGTTIPIPAMDRVAFSTAVLPSGLGFTAVAVTETDTIAVTAAGTEAGTVVAGIVVITTIITKVETESSFSITPFHSEIRLCFQGTELFFLRGREPDLIEICLISVGHGR